MSCRPIQTFEMSAFIIVILILVLKADAADRKGLLRLTGKPTIYDIRHKKICYSKATYCGHPRQTMYRNYGKAELVAGHFHAPCKYEVQSDVAHDHRGYHMRAVCLLQRSLDGGKTWPAENNVVVYDETMSTKEKKAFLYQKDAPRDQYDMFSADSLFFFGRTYLPEDRGGTPVCFALRSPDRGKSWEKVPTVITNPKGPEVWVHKDGHPVVRMPDGKTLLSAMSSVLSATRGGGVLIYASTDHGITWEHLSDATPEAESGRFTYAGLLLLPNGELQLYTLHIGSGSEVRGIKDAICTAGSMDGGRTWGPVRPIVRSEGQAAWGHSSDGGKCYRSPWPMLLNDGRIMVVFARRRIPTGIGGTVSRDGGKSWSEEFVIRNDGVGADLGYPIGSQLANGLVVVSYYYTADDGNGFGGTRYIAQSSFRIK